MRVLIKLSRKVHGTLYPERSRFGRNWHIAPNKDYANSLIRSELSSDKPSMIARLGSNELQCMTNYIGVKGAKEHGRLTGYVRNQSPPWWWNKSGFAQMEACAGFFPANEASVERFCELMISSLPSVDILGSWLKEESFFSPELAGAKKVMLEDLEPFFSMSPWTVALEGKKVLVVHPFSRTIIEQYKNRRLIFDNGLLPDFELLVIPAVQTIGGGGGLFRDWFSALDFMKSAIDKVDFDVCILGCGAYGFPLAAHVKKMGKKAIHLGGATQLLFGIVGRRWENYIIYPYANLFNEYWRRPSATETPDAASRVEGGCYW